MGVHLYELLFVNFLRTFQHFDTVRYITQPILAIPYLVLYHWNILIQFFKVKNEKWDNYVDNIIIGSWFTVQVQISDRKMLHYIVSV